jgi:hypothetical protein
MTMLRNSLYKNVTPDFSIRAWTMKERRVVESAILTYLNTAVGLLAEQMPNPKKTGGQDSRKTQQRKGTVHQLRERLIQSAIQKLKEEQDAPSAPQDDHPSTVTDWRLELNAPIQPGQGVKRKQPEAAESDDDGTNEGGVKAYKDKLYPSFRFSCMTRRVLYDVLVEEIHGEKLPQWPRKLVKNANDGTIQYEYWVPSLSYFLRVLRGIRNISFWKNPSFTKCNTCVALRECERQRTIAPSERDNIRKARNQHCFYIMSEVLYLVVVSGRA